MYWTKDKNIIKQLYIYKKETFSPKTTFGKTLKIKSENQSQKSTPKTNIENNIEKKEKENVEKATIFSTWPVIIIDHRCFACMHLTHYQNTFIRGYWHNLVPRVFSFSNMAMAGENTLRHSNLKRSLIGSCKTWIFIEHSFFHESWLVDGFCMEFILEAEQNKFLSSRTR